jgi:hypothetical protein
MRFMISFFKLSIVLLFLLATAVMSAGQDKKQIAYGMLLDSTGSMRSQFPTVLDIGKTIAQQTHEHGPVSIFNFASERPGGPPANAMAIERLERSQDKAQLDRTIDNLYIEGGQTTLLDAIEYIGERLREESPNADQFIILVTDGEERSSHTKQKQLVQQLKDWKIKVFAVGLVRELDSGKRSKAIDLLELLARETGGRAVFLKSEKDDVSTLVSALGIPIQ